MERMCGTGVHLDRAAGAERAFVISLSGADGLEEGTLTIAPGSAEAERVQLAASGTSVLHRHPEAASFAELMSPTSVPGALAMGARQGRADSRGAGRGEASRTKGAGGEG